MAGATFPSKNFRNEAEHLGKWENWRRHSIVGSVSNPPTLTRLKSSSTSYRCDLVEPKLCPQPCPYASTAKVRENHGPHKG